MIPVRPFPALQWIATMFFGWSSSHRDASIIMSSIICSAGALWSSNGYTDTRFLNTFGSYVRSPQRL